MRSVRGAAAEGGRTPLIITFEDMARGLHFDAVDAVFILKDLIRPRRICIWRGAQGDSQCSRAVW